MQFLKAAEVKLREWRNALAPLRYKGDAVFCPVCEHSFSHFLPAGTGDRRRDNAVCPYCRSRERDRLTWLFVQSRPDLFDYRKMQFLHVAPEPRLGKYFSDRVGEFYVTADLMRRDVMVRMDVMDIQYPNCSFDAIYCSHVFQDVPDDRVAINECYRVLRPGGWAILNVPLHGERTEENATPDKPRAPGDERPDEHVRSYGPDYAERLAEAGFSVETLAPANLQPDPAERSRQGLDGNRVGFVHFVRKPR